MKKTKRQEEKQKTEQELLLIEADADANRFNLKCMGLLALFSVLSYLLDRLGLFSVPEMIMLPSSIAGMLFFSFPVVIYLIRDKWIGCDQPVIEHPRFKYLIIGSAYVGIALFCVSLSFHAVLLLAVPPLLAAQYHDRRKLFFRTLILTILLVPIGVYGSFFFGMTDRNFFKGMLTDEEAMLLANRIAIATPERMRDIFLHYVIPRLLCVVAVVLLADGIVRRNKRMLSRQNELSSRVKEEMERVNDMQSHVINALASIIETRDTGTGEHVIRTGRFVRTLAQALSKEDKYRDTLTPEEIDLIVAAAPLHDVGKIAVSDTILLKPAKLTPGEFEIIKSHTTIGKSMIRNIFRNMENEKFLKTAEDIAGGHHEKWDGSGYPSGLRGENIPLSARIMAVADVFDALSSERVYKKAIPPEVAIDEMMKDSGTHFDPDVMRVVWQIREELIACAKAPIQK